MRNSPIEYALFPIMKSGKREGKSLPYMHELDYWLTFHACTHDDPEGRTGGGGRGLVYHLCFDFGYG